MRCTQHRIITHASCTQGELVEDGKTQSQMDGAKEVSICDHGVSQCMPNVVPLP